MQLFPLVNNTNEGQEKFHYQKIFLPFCEIKIVNDISLNLTVSLPRHFRAQYHSKRHYRQCKNDTAPAYHIQSAADQI